jgi:hypothetical protein
VDKFLGDYGFDKPMRLRVGWRSGKERQMADTNTTVHIGENSPEHVAYRLMADIAKIEDKALYRTSENEGHRADRKWILDTYAECLSAVQQPWNRSS